MSTKWIQKRFNDMLQPKVPNNQTLSEYEGPTSLIIPGNHDWYDGLRSFYRLICCRSWLGMVITAKHTYFSCQLPHNWWVFAVDYALNGDIDSAHFNILVMWLIHILLTEMESDYNIT